MGWKSAGCYRHQFSVLFEYETNAELVAKQDNALFGSENKAGGGEGVTLNAGGCGDGATGNTLNG